MVQSYFTLNLIEIMIRNNSDRGFCKRLGYYVLFEVLLTYEPFCPPVCWLVSCSVSRLVGLSVGLSVIVSKKGQLHFFAHVGALVLLSFFNKFDILRTYWEFKRNQ